MNALFAFAQQAAGSSGSSGSSGTTVQQSVGYVVLFIVLVVVIVYAFTNVRKARRERGAEVEIAPNRKPYLTDAELEGKKLDRTLRLAFLSLGVIAIVLPLYWLREPGRQKNAVQGQHDRFVAEGSMLFAPSTQPGGLNCAFCHGGMKATGGVASYAVTDSSGKFIEEVNWRAPALDTVALRYSRDEIRYILTYGRPFSPMPAWGEAGGGPLDTQEIEDLIDYLDTIQLTPKQAQDQVQGEVTKMMAQKGPDGAPMWKNEGEALFNLGYDDNFAGGAYSCGRCHTPQWSYGAYDQGSPGWTGPLVPYTQLAEKSGGGAFGPPLYGILDQFRSADDQVQFVCQGSVDGKQYGVHGQGSGRMPAFCEQKAYDPVNDVLNQHPNVPTVKQGGPGDGMLTQDMVKQIVAYERQLATTHGDTAPVK